MTGLSLTKKLIGAFGLVFTVFSLFGLFINFYFQSISNERSNLKDWLASNITVSKITRGIAETQRQVHIRVEKMNTQAKSELDRNIQNVDSAFAEYQQNLNNSFYDDESERQRDQNMLNDEMKLWQNYKDQISKIEPLIAANNRESSLAFLNGDLEKSFVEISNAMNADSEDCATGLSEAVDISEKIFANIEDLVHIMGIVIFIILVIIVAVLYFLAKDINNSVKQIVLVTEKAAQGNLTKDIITEATDEFGVISSQINSVIQHMRKALGKVQNAAQEVSNSAENMKGNVNKTGDLLQNVAMAVTDATGNVDSQKEAIKDTQKHVHQMEKDVAQSISAMKAGLESVEQTAKQAAIGNDIANETVRQMNEVAKSVDESAKIVQELGNHSKEIGSIVEVISSIAEQTNLLALNAAIEAARAGEAGRGFAVVADEVRKLAESSQESVQKIGKIVETIQNTIEKAVQTMQIGHKLVQEGRQNVESTGNSFHEIVNMIKRAEENSNKVMNTINNLKAPILDIVNRTEKISKMSIDIAVKMESISIATAEQAGSIMEISDNSGSLTELSQNMETTVNEFQLKA